jgi:hypothetical protein
MNIEGSNLQNKAFPNSAAAAGDNQIEFWTTECFVDEVFLGLVQVEEIHQVNNKEIHVRRYYRQARDLFKWIPIARPSPAFIIYISDLTPELKAQLKELISKSPDSLPYVLTQAVGRIFENLDFQYYHMSIARNLRVRLEK